MLLVSVISINRIYFFNKILVFYSIFILKNVLSFFIQFWSLKILFIILWINFEFPSLWNYYFTLYALKCKNSKLMATKWGVNRLGMGNTYFVKWVEMDNWFLKTQPIYYPPKSTYLTPLGSMSNFIWEKTHRHLFNH